MAEDQIRPLVMLVMTLPVMPFEGLLALDHLSADGAPPVLLAQDLRTEHRRRSPRQLAVTMLKGGRPDRGDGGGVTCDLDVALRLDHRSNPDDLFSGNRISEPLGFPRGPGKVASYAPAPSFVRVASFGPSRAPPPYKIVELGKRRATDDMAVIARPPAQHGVEDIDELCGGRSRGSLTEGFDPRFERLEAGVAGRHLELAELAVGPLIVP
jgi:hypothetical protein